MAIQSQSFTDYLNARRAEVMGQFAQATGQQAPTRQVQPSVPVAQSAITPDVMPQKEFTPGMGSMGPRSPGSVQPMYDANNGIPQGMSSVGIFGPFRPATPEERQAAINEQFRTAQQNQMQQFLADQDRYFANQRNTDAQWNQVNQLYQPWTTPQVSPQFPQFPTQDNRAQIPQQPQSPARQSIADEVGTAMAQREQQQRAEARFRDNNHAGARFIREVMRYNQP